LGTRTSTGGPAGRAGGDVSYDTVALVLWPFNKRADVIVDKNEADSNYI